MDAQKLLTFIGATVYVFNSRSLPCPSFGAEAILRAVDGTRAQVFYTDSKLTRWVEADRVETDREACIIRCLRSDAAPIRITPAMRRNFHLKKLAEGVRSKALAELRARGL